MITIGEHRTYVAVYGVGGAIASPCGDAVLRSVADLQNVAPQYGTHPDSAEAALQAAWCAAMNSRRQFEWTHFCGIRNDVKPYGDDWLSLLLDELRRVGTSWLSVVLPLPGGDGLTNCAVERDVENPSDIHMQIPRRQEVRRLTMNEVDPLPHITFNAEEALSPGGKGCRILGGVELFVCDFRRDWVDQVSFAPRHYVTRRRPEQPMPGAGLSKLRMPEDWAADEFTAVVEPGGWTACRQLHERGAAPMATKRLPAARLGPQEFGNMTAWGKAQAEWQTTNS